VKLSVLKLILQRANTAYDLSVVAQVLSINQLRYINEFEIDETVILFCKAAARIGLPDLGMSFLKTTWLRMNIHINAINNLLQYYAEESEHAFLYKAMEAAPFQFREIESLKSNEEEEDEDTEFKKKIPNNPEAIFRINFEETYNFARQEYNSHLKPNNETYSYVSRYYSGLGEIEKSEYFFKEMKNQKMELTLSSISSYMMALTWKGKANEAISLIPTEKSDGLNKALFTVYLALNNEEKLLECIQKEKDLTVDFCKVHFGVKERIDLLTKILTGDKIPKEVVDYINSLSPPIPK